VNWIWKLVLLAPVSEEHAMKVHSITGSSFQANIFVRNMEQLSVKRYT
jgi:hypothetical protein